MRRIPFPLAALGAAVLIASGCGGGGDDESTATPSEIVAGRQVVVFADSSLREPITVFGNAAGVVADNHFGDSSELANEILTNADAGADVFVAAGERFPNALYGEGLTEKPVVFARKGDVTYVAAAVKGGEHAALGKLYVQSLVSPTGAQVMSEAGLQPVQ